MRSITRVMSVTSGKGGAGKTHCVINLAIALARQGRSVLVLDADLGLANIDVMLGLTTNRTLKDVVEGNARMEDITLHGPEGISVIPATSGVEWMCHLTPEQRMTLMHEIERVAQNYDYLLIDTAAGIGSDVMYFNSASNEIVVVINGEPTSLTDAYATIKVLSQNYGEKAISVLANNVPNEKEAKRAFAKLSASVERFLHVRLTWLGWVPTDPALRDALSQQRAVLDLFPSSPASRAYCTVAERVDNDFLRVRVKGGMQFFFKQLLDVTAYGN